MHLSSAMWTICSARPEKESIGREAGLPLDPDKSEEGVLSMIALGARLSLSAAEVLLTVAEDKAAFWVSILLDILITGVCAPELALKMAGRLSFTVTLAANRVARAYIRAFYAQGHAPLAGNAISIALRRGCRFFIQYLVARVIVKKLAARNSPHINIWSDATGAGRKIAFFAHHPVTGWTWSSWSPPEEVYLALLARDDHNIQYQELAGVAMALATLSDQARDSRVTFWQDNQAILGALIAGGGNQPEVNAVVGRTWLTVCDLNCHAIFGRVESKANVADGPTRDDLTWVQALNAQYVELVLPEWLLNPWVDPLFVGE